MNRDWFIDRLEKTNNGDQFIQYAKDAQGSRALFKRIPIGQLDSFKNWLGNRGLVKIRYRGPRFNLPSSRGRGFISMASTCLKGDATHFSVYRI